MEYTVVREDYLDELVIHVNKKIAMGWKPVGGVNTLTIGMGYKYLQTMVKEK